MFGTNVLRKQKLDDGEKLFVQSIFPTIQGEGPFAGRPAVFLRLAGCNLRCHFCDTDFESKRQEMPTKEVLCEVILKAGLNKNRRTSLVVITGGEPLLQNIVPLCRELCFDYGFDIQIETAGTVWISGLEALVNSGALTIVCSPKTGKVHEEIQKNCYDWKYLIQEGQISPGDGLPNKSTQVPGKELVLYRSTNPRDTIWLQPCEAYRVGYKPISPNWTPGTSALDAPLADQEVTTSVRDEEQTQRNMRLCGELAMKYNYRVSVQLHKILGLP